MKKVIAKLKLYDGDKKRGIPFTDGYRPTFNFIKESRISGRINLLNQESFSPGEESVVMITFINQNLLGEEFTVGTEFKFYEAKEPLGEGVVLDIICSEINTINLVKGS